MVNCPFCNSPRIISARHDSDWGDGNSIGTVNSDEVYAEGDLTEEGDVYSFGDINILVCLGCDYTWQRYGSFRPTQREPDVFVRCEKCNALIETTVHCDNCGTFAPTRG
jgi:hypothetical protein